MTLAVSTFYSDRIRCSVDIVGMSNLVTFLEHTEAYRRDLRRVEYGDERDPKMREFLEKIAPMNNIEKIKKPMFVMAGKNDPRVPVSESQQIADALKKQGTPVWLLIAKDEGHGYRKKVESGFSVLCDGGVFAGVFVEIARPFHVQPKNAGTQEAALRAKRGAACGVPRAFALSMRLTAKGDVDLELRGLGNSARQNSDLSSRGVSSSTFITLLSVIDSRV